jgi:hypothetical protein
MPLRLRLQPGGQVDPRRIHSVRVSLHFRSRPVLRRRRRLPPSRRRRTMRSLRQHGSCRQCQYQ